MKTQTAWKTIAALILVLLLNSCTAVDQPAMLPTATATLMSTATLAPWWPTENVPYPLDSTGFQLAGGSDEQAHQRIIELGAGEDLAALEEMYKAELRRTGKNPDSYTFEEMVWESGGKVYWDSVVKDGQGHYLGMKLTKGSEAGQVVRAFGLTRYLLDYTANDDFYDFFTLQNPTEFPDAKQQMIWDESGWHVVGLFTESGKLLGWFNADKGGSGQWEMEETVQPTPDTPIGRFSGLEGVVHTENGYKITVGDSQRVVEITEANAEKQIVFDEEFNLYKIFDADGYITAEYDPGQGNEGDAGYVPATGWVDIQKLAKDFICKEGSGESCMNLTTNNSVYFESISAGIWRYVDAIDDAGHILGRALLVQMASRTNEQQPTIYWLLAEAVPKDSPEYSTLSYVPFMIAEKGINPLDYYHKVFPIEKFMESVPKGYVLTLIFGLNGRSYLYWFDHSIQTADNDVLSMLESRGQTGNLMNVIMNDSGHKGR